MEIDVEEFAKQQIVAKVLENMTDDKRNELLENSLSRVLTDDIFSRWNIAEAMREDAKKYLIEYINRDDVQLRIKENAEKSFDNVIKEFPSLFEDDIKRSLRNIK